MQKRFVHKLMYSLVAIDLYCHRYVNQYVPFNLYTCMLTFMFLYLKVITTVILYVYLRLLD